MKRLAKIASLAVLASAITATGAYAAAPEAVTAFVNACCAACGMPCCP